MLKRKVQNWCAIRIPKKQNTTETTNSGWCAIFNVNEFYRKEFIQILDTQLSSLTDNVTVPLEMLLPLANSLQPWLNQIFDKSDCQLAINMLPVGLQSEASALEAEVTVFGNYCYQNKAGITTTEKPVIYTHQFRSLFPLTRKWYQLHHTVPITSASCERNFTKSKLIKTHTILHETREVIWIYDASMRKGHSRQHWP